MTNPAHYQATTTVRSGDTIDTIDAINRLVSQTRALLNSLGDSADLSKNRMLADGLWLATDQLGRIEKEVRKLI